MERGSDKHGARLDDAMSAEVSGEVRGGGPTRTEEWHQAEPEGEDQRRPYPRGGPEPGTSEGLTPQQVELRSELAQHLDQHAFPGDRATLERVLVAHHAPDRLLEAVRSLPGDVRFRNLNEAARSVAGRR
jgi:hypothetical protein